MGNSISLDKDGNQTETETPDLPWLAHVQRSAASISQRQWKDHCSGIALKATERERYRDSNAHWQEVSRQAKLDGKERKVVTDLTGNVRYWANRIRFCAELGRWVVE